MFFRKRQIEKEQEFQLKCETLYQFAKKRFTLEDAVIGGIDFHPCIRARQYVLDLIDNGLIDVKYKLLWQRKGI